MAAADYLEPRLAGRAERWLFAPVNPASAAAFRAALGVALPLFFWSRGLELQAWAAAWPGVPEVYSRVFLTSAYWLLILGLSFVFGLGWRPRPTGLALAALLLPLGILNEGQQSRQMLLFTLLAFSLVHSDARFALSRGPGAGRPASAGPMWPIRLIQLQLSVVYGVNALAKTTPAYLSGEVLVAMSQILPNMLVDLSDGYLHLGPLAVPVMIAAVASVATEYYLAIGFWFRRLRVATAVVGALFHLILSWIIVIHLLNWAAMLLYLAFLLPFDRQPEPSPGYQNNERPRAAGSPGLSSIQQ